MDLYIHIKYDLIAKILTWDYNCVVNCLSELERCNLLKINNNGILAVKGFSDE